MSADTFRAVLLEESAEGGVTAAFRDIPKADLPDGDVLVRVAYSSLNYKDGLALTGTAPIARRYPMIPGVDLAGTVLESRVPDFVPGDSVLVCGCELSEKYWGGYAELASLQAGWLVRCPSTLTPVQAMGIGTAGFTAMMAVMALQAHHVTPDRGEVVVTGASGGVGSLAVAILAAEGYTVTAVTGRAYLSPYLRSLGASTILDREEMAEPQRPLDRARWAGAVDSVGGGTLATLLSQMQPGGSIAACGLAASAELHTTVYPLILRGVNLLGIHSVIVPPDYRAQVWARLGRDLPLDRLATIMRVEPFSEVFDLAAQIVAGQIQGRVALEINA
jgi:acrylyl-CoA reductase (NADPH)